MLQNRTDLPFTSRAVKGTKKHLSVSAYVSVQKMLPISVTASDRVFSFTMSCHATRTQTVRRVKSPGSSVIVCQSWSSSESFLKSVLVDCRMPLNPVGSYITTIIENPVSSCPQAASHMGIADRHVCWLEVSKQITASMYLSLGFDWFGSGFKKIDVSYEQG